jgi:hypothetical protein
MIELWRGMGMAARVSVGIVAAIAVVVALWWAWSVVRAPQRAAEAKVEARASGAYAASARVAMDIVTAAADEDAKTRKEIADEVERIKGLPEDQRYAASIDVLCGLREYHGSPQCRAVQQSRPK